MSSRRRVATWAAAASLAMVVVVLAAPALVGRGAATALRTRGFDAHVSLDGGTLVLRELRWARSGVTVECDEVRVRMAAVASLRSRAPVVRRVHVDACSAFGREQIDGGGTVASPSTELGRPAPLLRNVGSVEIDRVAVDLSLGLVDVRGVGSEIVGSGGDVPSMRARWAGTAPLPWSSELSADLHDGRLRVVPAEPIRLGDRTVRADSVTVGPGRSATVEGVRFEAPHLSGTIARIELDDGTVTIDGARADVRQQTPTTVEGPPSVPVDEAAEGALPPSDDSADEPPRAYATETLRALSRVPERAAAARVDLTALARRLPFRFRITDGTVRGVPVCGTVRFERAEATPSGIDADVLCGAWRMTGTVPDDPDESIDLVVDGFEIAALPGDTGGRADMSVRIDIGPGTVTIAADGRIEDARLRHPAIAREPIEHVSARLAMEATVRPPAPGPGPGPGDTAQPDMSVSWTAAIGEVPLDGSATATRAGDTWEISAETGVSELTPCSAMWEAIPDGLVPRLRSAGVVFSGEARPRMRVRYTAGDPASFDLRVDGFMGDCAIDEILPPYDPRELLTPEYLHTVTEGTTTPVDVGPGSGSWTPLDSVPSYVPALMWLSEEIAFFDNSGFSPMLIRRAVRMNLREGRYVYGGSTVSQQLVKNLYFDRDKTLSRKLEEAIVVWAMEQWVPKTRILELYMNCIEFAPDVWGIGPAAIHYFGVDAATLTPLEAAFLAALKPAPWMGERYRQRGSSPDTGWWQERIRVLLQRLVDNGPYIEQSEVDHFAPYVATFPPVAPDPGVGIAPTEPEAWTRRRRPKLAVEEALTVARARLGFVDEAPAAPP